MRLIYNRLQAKSFDETRNPQQNGHQESQHYSTPGCFQPVPVMQRITILNAPF
jgi:hypothetical protein